jgi:signal transduction histidine kinase
VLDKAVTLTTTPEIAVNAFVHAMHRVRTSIDVALGCSEEIVEITSQDQVKRSAAESAAALRLIYHYTNELSDLSSLGAFMAHQENVPVDCGEILDSAAADLGYVANDAGVALERVSSGTPVVIAHTRPQLLKQTLSYIILNSITSPSVRRVSYDFHGGDEIVFVVKGDGCGTTLEERASAGTFSAMLGEASNYGGGSDASGFAVARRLAWALSGHIIFESTPGSGDTLMLNIPRLPSRPPLANR